jgi:hypothetical protein
VKNFKNSRKWQAVRHQLKSPSKSRKSTDPTPPLLSNRYLMPQRKRLLPWPPLNIPDVIQKLLFDLHCLTTTLGCTPKCGNRSGITFAPSCVLPSLEGSSACLVTAERCDDHRFSFCVAACISGRQCQRIDPELWSHEMTVDDLYYSGFCAGWIPVYKSNDMLYALVSPALGDLNRFSEGA